MQAEVRRAKPLVAEEEEDKTDEDEEASHEEKSVTIGTTVEEEMEVEGEAAADSEEGDEEACEEEGMLGEETVVTDAVWSFRLFSAPLSFPFPFSACCGCCSRGDGAFIFSLSSETLILLIAGEATEVLAVIAFASAAALAASLS